jgi:F420-dependent oxidoreductase-like protein
MELRIFTEPQQGATYEEVLAVALAAERLGFPAFFRSDHYQRMGAQAAAAQEPGPTDAWITLAGLARDTSTIRLGTLVSAATFRQPGPLAIAVATVDQMSGGRVDFGLGTGWYEAEHASYGIPFPPLGRRFEMLEEQLEIIDGLWTTPLGQTYSFSGRHYTLTDSPALPKPAQSPRPPIVVGGGGPKRTPAIAARFADEFNVAFRQADFTAEQFGRVRAAVDAAGRAADSMVYSAAQVLCVGSDEAQLTRRAAALGREVDELRLHGVAGTVDEAIAKIERFAEAGATRLYLQVMDLSDIEHLELVAAEIMPRV